MSGLNGTQTPSSAATDFNAISFLVQALINQMATATLVKVKAVTNSGGVVPVGFVDILPLVNQVDGDGVAVPHGTIFRCPYMRLQGGANAIIIDPEVGDIGVAVFADRDISSATANRGQANPGSARRFDMADGLYLGGFLNGEPSQFVQMASGGGGITIESPTLVKLIAPDVQINCATLEIDASSSVTITTPTFTVNGNTVANGNVTSTGTVLAPTLNGTTQVLAAGKDVGPLHVHDHGTMTASGHTGTVI